MDLLDNKSKDFKDGFELGLEIITTIDRNLSYSDIEEVWGIHRSTVLSWSRVDLNDYKNGYKKVMSEYLKRYNPKNTLELMKKYSLSATNTRGFISEKFFMDIEEIDKMEISTIRWKQTILKNLLKINRDLFEKQLETIKKIIKQEMSLLLEDEEDKNDAAAS